MDAINAFKEMIGGITSTTFGGVTTTTVTGLIKDLANLAILQAQYGDKAESLFNLQKWYDAMKALVGTSGTAMTALTSRRGFP